MTADDPKHGHPLSTPGHVHVDPHEHDHEHAHPHAHPHRRPASLGAKSPAVARPAAVIAPATGSARVLHLDCFAGLAGDMIVGALLDLGVPREVIGDALGALPVANFAIGVERVEQSSIAATRFVVDVGADQPHRTWADVRAMLEASALSDGVRRRALAAFGALAVAEGRVHRVPPDEVHFHEVGAVDAIVDIVAASAALEWLGAAVCCAPLPMGRGFVTSEHGRIPLPAPAVVELLAGIPTVGVTIDAELVTPTGAAIVRANATRFENWPAMRPIGTGFGAGTRTLPDRPNALRVVLGEVDGGSSPGGTHAVVETNVDDATGEHLAHTCAALLADGALDVWTTAIGMKKGRPGTTVSALVEARDVERIARTMLANGTSIGVRIRAVDRIERPRRSITVHTPFGEVRIKVADGDGLPATVKPEDDDVASLARTHGVPVRAVQAAAIAAFDATKTAPPTR